MLQLSGRRSRFRENGTHLSALLTHQASKVRRYRKINVASGLVLDVMVVIPDVAYMVRITNRPVCSRRTFAFRPPASQGVSSRGFL